MQDPIYSKIEATPRPTLFAASGFVWLAAIGLWLSELILFLLPKGWDTLALDTAVYYLPFVALPVLLYTRKRPGLSESMRLNPLPLFPMLSVALLALLSVFAASLLTGAWGAALDTLGLRSVGSVAVPETERELAIAILVMGAVPAICEELLFRGFALAAWESRGTWFAIGVTTGLFALLHGNLYGLPAYLLVGATAGFVTFALDSLYAGMVYHTLYNAACLIIPWAVSGSAVQEEAAAAISPFSLALEGVTILAMMAVLLASLRLRARRCGHEPIPRIHHPLDPRERLMLLGALLTMAATMVILQILALQQGGVQ